LLLGADWDGVKIVHVPNGFWPSKLPTTFTPTAPPPFQHFPLVKLSYTCKAPKESWAEGRRGSRDSGQEELNMHGYVLELDCQVGELAACHGS